MLAQIFYRSIHFNFLKKTIREYKFEEGLEELAKIMEKLGM